MHPTSRKHAAPQTMDSLNYNESGRSTQRKTTKIFMPIMANDCGSESDESNKCVSTRILTNCDCSVCSDSCRERLDKQEAYCLDSPHFNASLPLHATFPSRKFAGSIHQLGFLYQSRWQKLGLNPMMQLSPRFALIGSLLALCTVIIVQMSTVDWVIAKGEWNLGVALVGLIDGLARYYSSSRIAMWVRNETTSLITNESIPIRFMGLGGNNKHLCDEDATYFHRRRSKGRREQIESRSVQQRNFPDDTDSSPEKSTNSRTLSDGSSWGPFFPSKSDAKLVIAGKVRVAERECNIAQLNLGPGNWSLKERIQLSLYDSSSEGQVYSLLANHTFSRLYDNNEGVVSSSDGDDKSRVSDRGRAGGNLIVVGAFDTTYLNSQVTYCSVGKWDGFGLSKVGEGLCNSALSKGMKIISSALAGPDDVYVAGSFHTRVWNGDRNEFVKIFNLAHYNAATQVWLPLPAGQITCTWCTVTVLSMAWDSTKQKLHIGGKFNSIDGRIIPAGLAIYDAGEGRLLAHPGGGLSMLNKSDGVATALQLDEANGVLYVMGSFEKLTVTGEICLGLAAYEINSQKWTCVADAAHSVIPTGGGNMLLTPYGLMVAGRTTESTTWKDDNRPYTIAVLTTTLKKSTFLKDQRQNKDGIVSEHEFTWSWLPGFEGWTDRLHALANGFGDFEGTVFIGGEDLIVKWFYEKPTIDADDGTEVDLVPRTVDLSNGRVKGSIMAIAQLDPFHPKKGETSQSPSVFAYTVVVYWIALGVFFGMFLAILCNRNLTSTLLSFLFARDRQSKGISLDMLTYGAIESRTVSYSYERAMQTRFVQDPHLLPLINPQEIILHRIIGEGTFGRVWSAKWRSSAVAVKEFVFAQAAVAGKSSQQNEIIEEIIGEAGMMAILRHPNVLQLFGCSLTVQAIWIVSELCSLGSLRQVLDDDERDLSLEVRVRIALQVAEGMCYLHTQDPPIIHRDLKSHNIFVHETFTECDVDLLDSDRGSKRSTSEVNGYRYDSGASKMVTGSTLEARIGDWGSARATLAGSRTMTHGVGTACWLAPEVIKHARSSRKSDVYGFGIILWEMATREEVYNGLESMQIIARVANENLRPPIPTGCLWTSLMTKCWSENPKDRPDFEEVVQELNQIKITLAPSEKETETNGYQEKS